MPKKDNSKIIFGVVLAVAAIAVVWILRPNFGSGEVKIGNTSAKVQTREQKPGVSVEDAKTKGKLDAVDETGRGVEAKRVEAEKDIILRNATTPKP